MNQLKSFAFLAFSLTLLVLGAAFSSAALSFTNPSNTGSLTIGTNATITLESTVATAGTLTFIPSQIALGGATVTLGTDPVTFSFTGSQSVTIFVKSISGQLPFGEHTLALNATETATGLTATTPITYRQSFCRVGAIGTNLTIDNIDISSSGDEDEEWKLIDSIDVEVKVENRGDDDLDDVQVELALFDASTGRNVVNDLDFSNTDEEQIDIGSLNDGDDETVNFEFKVPADFDTGSYRLAVKVYSEDAGESRECDDTADDLSNNFFQTISVDSEDEEEKFIVVDDINMPEQATCEETVTGSFTVFNIGDEDQDQILITMKNTELGLNEEFEIREDLDQGDEESLDFVFDVPASARDGTYLIAFKTFYDYDDGDYDEESEDQFTATLRILGCSGQPSAPEGFDISADLDSDAQAGAPLRVTATITNNGDETVTLRVDAEGYESWATLGSISQRTLTLAPGDSESVQLTFDVATDVTGTESFTITATSGDRVEAQEVEIDFGNAGTGPGFSFFQGSGLIWLIAIINVILIALIIVVAIRVSRR